MRRELLLSLITAVSAIAPALGQIAPVHRERQPTIVATYRAALGRDPSSAELYYWELYPATPPGIINPRSLFAALLQTLRNSPAEREATARRALSTAFAEEETGNPRLRAYLADGRNPPLRRAMADLVAERGGGGYRGLLAWLGRPDIRRQFDSHAGMAAARAPRSP